MLEKKYNHKLVEEGKYEFWKDNNYFKSGDLTKEPFCIVIPPPNVTGKLHLGHAWDTTLQDIIIRYKKLDGYDTLWLPGMDHAGIATQAKVDKKLKEEGINPRDMDREEWLKVAWKWKEEYGENIHRQWAKLGLSLDYSKERFTLDEGLSNAVKKVFVDLYNKGLIYQGYRIINWDPQAKTALSNEEVIYKETKGYFYHLKYFLEDSTEYLEVATTRPETLFGDTAVAVNPNDPRYKQYIGKNVVLPIVGKKIPVIADIHADMDFGTGVVKITPAHDPNDYEVGRRHKLESIIVMDESAIMNENALNYQGLDRFTCRDRLIEDLTKQGLLISKEEITHNVGYSERTDVMVEPYLSKQWFVKMRPLADRVLANQKDKNNKVNFIPARFEKIMNHWMEITYDWCISRQLWWGHRIPAWYKDDQVYVGLEAPKEEGWVQDADVLDTWFSSALWPFSTLGWPDNTELLNRYYPNNVLVTGYDIIPFWVNRMTFQGLEFMNKRPFKECLIHGLIRDKLGRKMSKSLGNGVDPMDVIDEYGCDSLRYFLATSTSSGMDLRYDTEKVKSTWNFINKLWNASRYVLMNAENYEYSNYQEQDLTMEDKWILTRLNETIKVVRKHMDKYEFNIVGNTLYSFIWNDFCDKYIELSKFNKTNTTNSVLIKVLTNILIMMHPFMPYVTEEIYSTLPNKKYPSIMLESYPKYNKKEVYSKEEEIINNVLEFVTLYRNKKAELKTNDYQVLSKVEDKYIEKILIHTLKLQDKLTNIDNSNLKKEIIKLKELELDILYDDTLFKEEELNNIKQDIDKLTNSITRRKNLLANVNYVNKAPANIVAKEREDLAKEEEKLLLLQSKLKQDN